MLCNLPQQYIALMVFTARCICIRLFYRIAIGLDSYQQETDQSVSKNRPIYKAISEKSRSVEKVAICRWGRQTLRENWVWVWYIVTTMAWFRRYNVCLYAIYWRASGNTTNRPNAVCSWPSASPEMKQLQALPASHNKPRLAPSCRLANLMERSYRAVFRLF